MAAFLDYPVKALPPVNAALAPGYSTRPGHEATNSMRRSLGMSGAAFRLKFNVSIHDDQTARAAHGFFFNMEADSQLVRIRLPGRYSIDGPFALATEPVRRAYPVGIRFSTGATYSTGVGQAIPTREARFQAAADLNARYIYATTPEELPGGCVISIDEFCYGIAGSWLSAGVNKIKLSPVLRKPASVGTKISLAPIFVGFCTTDTPGFEELRLGLFGEYSLEFVEDLTRLVADLD